MHLQSYQKGELCYEGTTFTYPIMLLNLGEQTKIVSTEVCPCWFWELGSVNKVLAV